MGHISVESNHFLFGISRYFESKWVDLVAYKMEKLKKFNCVICTDVHTCKRMWAELMKLIFFLLDAQNVVHHLQQGVRIGEK